MNNVTVGTTWVSSDRKMFTVKGVFIEGKDTWVHYDAKDTDRTYSCLIDAFLQRFSQHVN